MPVIDMQNTSKQLSEAFQHRNRIPANLLRAAVSADFRVHDRCTWLPGPIEHSLTRRRSVRVFAASALSRAHVLGAVAAAHEAEEAVWPPGQHGGVGLDVLIAAFNIEGMAKGLYAIYEANAELLSEDSACLGILRERYADAPVLMLVCADLNQTCRDAGPAGYQAALIRAGTLGYAAWLWSISMGLTGCVYGAASHHASGVGRTRNANLRHLFTVAIGMPAGSVSPRTKGGAGSLP